MAIPKAKQYILDFEQLGMGLFIHWGLYSQLGKGEWVFHHSDTTMDEYKKLKDTFTAEDFDAEKICEIAKNAGCRYITLTTRHHEGFSLYDTCGLNDFDAPNSPAKRDLIREFVDACRKYDIVPFFYHTTLDWYDKRFNEDFDAYLEYLRKSVEILCTNYGKIGGLWFDGNWSKPDSDWKEDELYATIRRHQPEAMIINNTGLGAGGKLGNPELDSVTFEQGNPEPMNRDGMEKYVAAEVCETINNHWGIGYEDIDYKSPSQILKSLCESRRVGANHLVNIGPEAQGKVNTYQAELLGLIGRWMKVYGEAVYNGRPCGIKGEDTHFALKSVDEKHLYFFVYDMGIIANDNVIMGGAIEDEYKFTGVTDEIESIKWMDEDEELEFTKSGTDLAVNFTGFHYGKSYPVRVAKAVLKK